MAMNSFGLNPNELAELEQMMGGGEAAPVAETPVAQAAAAQEPSNVAQAVAAEADAQAPSTESFQQEAQAPQVETDDQPGAPIRPVPYKRFQEVNSERASLKAERDELKAQLEAMRSLQGSRQAPAEATAKKDARTWLEAVLDGDEPSEEPAAKPDEIPEWGRTAMSMLEEIRQERSMQALDRVVAGIQEDYPDVPEEVILAGIAQGNSAEQIVQAWDHIGQAYAKAHGMTPAQAAAAQQAQQQQRPANADVAPRLSAAKGAMNAPEPPSWVKGWGKEHQNSVAAYIKSLG